MVPALEVKLTLPPAQNVVGPLAEMVGVAGNAITVTEPFTLLETHWVALLRTVNVNGIELPDAGELKFTVMGVAPNAPLVTVVIPVPEILY